VLVLALLLAAPAFSGFLVFAAAAFVPALLLTAYAVALVRRAPSRLAIGALAVSGVTSSYLVGQIVACLVTNDCFH
jgi:hypothetical protein